MEPGPLAVTALLPLSFESENIHLRSKTEHLSKVWEILKCIMDLMKPQAEDPFARGFIDKR